MTRIVLFEDAAFANLLPLTYWRTVFELRCARMSLVDRVTKMLPLSLSGLWTRAWIADVAAERFKLPVNQPVAAGDILINGRWISEQPPTFQPPPHVATCEDGIAYVSCDGALAKRLGPEDFLDRARWTDLVTGTPNGPVSGSVIQYPWDLVAKTASLLAADWDLSEAANDGDVHPSAILMNRNAIRIERGSHVLPMTVIDATDGPVVIEGGVTVGHHACIVGPACIGSDSVIHPHSFIHGGTSIGPLCKVAGEIDACVFQGYSNKAHAGFLGHAYVASWVNIGAGTTNSDLKNTYGNIRVPINGQEMDTGLTFFGCVIGDHVKTGIQQAISTGSVIGFAANIASSSILPRFVRSFTWLTDQGLEEGDARRLARTAAVAMKRREMGMTEAEQALFQKLPEIAAYFEPDLATQRAALEAASPNGNAVPMPQYGNPSVK